jgi:hypothetical protein
MFSPLLMGLTDIARSFCDPTLRMFMWSSNENFVLCSIDRAECLLDSLLEGYVGNYVLPTVITSCSMRSRNCCHHDNQFFNSTCISVTLHKKFP